MTTSAITDDKIATAIAKLHSDGAALDANVLETVTAFLKLEEIRDKDVTEFRGALRTYVADINECQEKQIRWDK